jgi:hypothetical protein
MFESARGFLKFEWYTPGDEPQHDKPSAVQFYHIPQLNQSSWSVAMSKMALDTDPVNVRVARVCGNVALRSCPDGLRAFQERLPPFAALDMENNPRMFKEHDLRQTCFYTVYEIFESDRPVQDVFVWCLVLTTALVLSGPL